MEYVAFIGGSYQSQAVTADQELTINLYPELLQSPTATKKLALYPSPGVDALSTWPTGGVGRGHIAINGREFCVIGTSFIEVDSSGAMTSRGTVAIDSRPATLASNGDGGNQIFVTSGTNGYCFDLSTNVLTQVTAMNGRCSQCDFIDGYFVVLDSATSTLFVSDLLDGATWTPGTDFAQRSLAPDRWKAMKVSNRLIWLCGEQTTEAWYDTGDNFPFAPAPSGLIQYGILAPYSLGIIGSDVIWLGTSRSGELCVIKMEGFTPRIISSYPLSAQIQNYRNVVDAIADVYSEAGHTFYQLNFDQDGFTHVWDTETQMWHGRGSWLPARRDFVAWRPRYYARAFNQHRILDASGATLYKMGFDRTGDVDGLEIRRVRRCPAIVDELKRAYYSRLELDLEPGLGTSEGEQITTEAINWTDVTLAEAVGGTITKDVEFDDSWDAGGVSVQSLLGAGHIQCIYNQEDHQRALGFTNSPTLDTEPDSLLFGFETDDINRLLVRQGTELMVQIAVTLTPGDVLRIAVDASGVVTFLYNGSVVYTSEIIATFPLYAQANLATTDSEISTATIAYQIGAPPSYDPVVMLRMSNDGGKTWGPEVMRSAGKMGEYLKRVVWNRLGSARRRVFEVAVSAPIPWRFVGAYLESTPQLPRVKGNR